LIDLAGAQSKKQIYFERNEINRSLNYLHYIFKDMSGIFSKSASSNLPIPTNPKLNKNSKILKEFSKVINGNAKLNIITLVKDQSDENSRKCLDFVKSLANIRIPLIKVKKTKIDFIYVEYL
jgi:hypothetical protein